MPRRRVRNPVEQLQPFEWGRIVDLRQAGWTYRQITSHVGHNVSVMCRCLRWSMEHSHTHRPGSGHLVFAATDRCHLLQFRIQGRVVQTHVKIDELCEQRWPPEQHLGKKSGYHVEPSVSLRTIGNRLLAAGLRSRVPLARLPLTPQHQARVLWFLERVDWRVDWRPDVCSYENSSYLCASDGRTRLRRRYDERRLPECIHPRHTGLISGFMVWGTSVTSRGHIWCFCRVK